MEADNEVLLAESWLTVGTLGPWQRASHHFLSPLRLQLRCTYWAVGIILSPGFSKSCYSGEVQTEVLDTQPTSDKINQKQYIIFWVGRVEISATFKIYKDAWWWSVMANFMCPLH